MKYLAFVAIALLSVASLVSSCGKGDGSTGGEHCEYVSPTFVMVNFSENEMDTIIIRRFEKANMFVKSLDTFMLSKAEITYKEIGDDSFSIASNKGAYKVFTNELYNNDWEIYIPATGSSTRLTEVNGRFVKQTEAGELCRSFTDFMRLDGNKREYTTWFGDSYRFYMVK